MDNQVKDESKNQSKVKKSPDSNEKNVPAKQTLLNANTDSSGDLCDRPLAAVNEKVGSNRYKGFSLSIENKDDAICFPTSMKDEKLIFGQEDPILNHRQSAASKSITDINSVDRVNELYNRGIAIDTARMVTTISFEHPSHPAPDETVLPLDESILDGAQETSFSSPSLNTSAVELRRISRRISRQWDTDDISILSLERRMRDFMFAQTRRRERHGYARPWGIMGLYHHLAGIRSDIEWAEDAAWRRKNKEPYFSWSDFDKSLESAFNKPFFTYVILFTCTTTLIWSIGKNEWKLEPLNTNPMIGPSSTTLLEMGAKQTSLIVVEGEWYRLFTPMFLHAGLIHYIFNMLALWFIGCAVEKTHGTLAAAVLFTVPAVGGTLLSAIFLPQYVSVGASGGIFGLIGACLVDIIMNWSLLFNKEVNFDSSGITTRNIKIVILLIADMGVNCILGFTPLVDNFTHLGGMLYGILVGMSVMNIVSSEFFGVHNGFVNHLKKIFIRFSGLILCVAAIMISVIFLFESDGASIPCDRCRYFSCVPFPWWLSAEKRWWNCDDCGLVSADARKDSSNNLFQDLTLKCPDSQLEFVDLSEEFIFDESVLAKDLPLFCRKFCENVFT